MHLLLIHQNFPGQFRDLGPAWLAMGHQITALGSAAAPTQANRWDGLTHLQYSVDGEDSPTDRQRGDAIATICRELQATESPPDLVLVHSGWGEAQRLREVFPTTPLVVYPELWGSPEALGFGFDHHLQELTPPPGCFDEQNQLSADAINASDAAIVSCIAQYTSFPAPLQQQLTVLPEGLNIYEIMLDDPTHVQHTNPERGSISPDLYKSDQPLVTLVSRYLEPLRGLRLAFEAWPMIAAAVPDARLVVVGQQREGYGFAVDANKDTSHLDTALSALPDSVDRNRIHVLEWIDHGDMLKLLRHSACHLALSYPYTLSWSVLEAMACGAPLISNYGSPIAPEITHNHNGLLIPFNEPEQLAASAISLLTNPALRTDLGDRAERTAKERFDLSTSLNAYEQLFKRLVGLKTLQKPIIQGDHHLLD